MMTNKLLKKWKSGGMAAVRQAVGRKLNLTQRWRRLPWVYRMHARRVNNKLLGNLPKPLKLHLGCGNICLDGYVNADIEDWSGRCDLICSATHLPMFADNTVDHIFHHAMLEHLPPWETIPALKEWFRVLKPGGTIQIETPDLQRIFEDWLVNGTLSEELALANIFGGNKTPDKHYAAQDHLTGFTFDRLARLMREAGFTAIERKEHDQYHVILVVHAEKPG